MHARHAFALAGLGAVALAAWLDRDLVQAAAFSPEAPRPEPPPSGTTDGRVYALGREWSDAAAALRELDAPRAGPGDPAWPVYLARRDLAWRGFAPALEGIAARLDALAAESPGEGGPEVLAGLAHLDLAVAPARASGDLGLAGLMRDDPRAAGREVQVRDPARVEAALERIERGLSRPRVAFGELRRGSPEELAGAGARGMQRFLARMVAATPYVQLDLAALRNGGEALVLLGLRRAAAGEPEADRPLRLARRLGLRVATRPQGSLIEVLVGHAIVHVADRAWLHVAATSGQGDLAHALSEEELDLAHAQSNGLLDSSVELHRLGPLDRMLVPLGGWGEGQFDATLGLRVGHAAAESLAVWALLGAGLLGLLVYGVALVAAAAPREAPPADGWTLGDLLGLVLATFGAAVALVLALARLHPLREQWAPEALAVQLPAAVLLAVVGFPLLLRRAALAKHGLRPASPGRARLAAGLLLAALLLGTGWTGQELGPAHLLPPALALAGAALAAWSHRLRALTPELKAAVLRYERRAAVSSLGAALLLVAAVDLALVRPRRLALCDAYGDQMVRLALSEAEVWGGGYLRGKLRRLEERAPDAPDLAVLRGRKP